MRHTKSIFIVGALLMSLNVYAQDENVTPAKEFCNIVQPELSAVNEQLPVSVDYMTKLIGTSALHTRGNDQCNITMTYQVDTEKFVESFVQETDGAMNFEQSVEFLNTKEGRDILSNVFKEQGEQEYQDYNIEGVKIKLQYKMDDSKLDNFSAILFN